jgi:reductive dehalogenase
LCTSCGKCVTNCPLGAILIAQEAHGQKAQTAQRPIDLAKWKQSPYIVDPTVFERFSEKGTIFARVQSDPNFQNYQVGIHSHLDVILKAKRPGYSRVDHALSTASWTVYDYFRGAFSWNKLTYTPDAKFDEGLSQPQTDKLEVTDRERMTQIVKHAARSYGAALVGICKLDRKWLYTHDRQGTTVTIPNHIENVIVMAIEMELEALQTTPAYPGAYATGNGYSRMAFGQACLAEFIRALGYDAIPAGNNLGLSVPLAIDAGLGQYGRHGLLITPEFGSNVRLCKVFTNLPLVPDAPIDFGALEFCRTCKTCADACPSSSISYDDNPSWTGPTISNNPGVLKWYVNVESCYDFWTRNGNDCSRCITSCPFTRNRHWSHGVKRFFIKHIPWLNRLWVKLDNWLGYGNQRNPTTFWKPEKEFIHTRKGNR